MASQRKQAEPAHASGDGASVAADEPGSPNDTPMMRQYHAAKKRYPHALLFFRLGDFYELFFEDAKVASRVLGLTLTSRSKGPDAIPMAGVPVHNAETYLGRLLRMGFSVSICDQTEDASQAKGLVKREITRVVTPGTVVEDNLLDARKPNRLVAVLAERPGDPEGACGLAAVDLSGGAIFVRETAGVHELAAELARLAPSECLLPEPAPLPPGAKAPPALPHGIHAALSHLKPEAFSAREAHARVLERFGSGKAGAAEMKKLTQALPLAARAAGALVGYLEEMHPGAAAHLQAPRAIDPEAFLELDEVAIRSLELVETLRDRGYEGSLLWTLDRTRTSAGARRLREWMLRPLRGLEALKARQEAVATLVTDALLREELREILKDTVDLERIAARLAAGRATPRDLIGLKNSLLLLPKFQDALANFQAGVLAALRERFEGLGPVAERIARTLNDDCPNSVADGGLIRAGVDAELDRLREVSSGGKQWIANFQTRAREESGISSLKVGYNQVFGYYIEVTKANLANVPKDFERRQTLANAERFVTPELKKYEAEVLGAEDKLRAIEARLFNALRDEVAQAVPRLQAAGAGLAELDALASLAEVAVKKAQVRPALSQSRKLFFDQMRHPVLEETLARGDLVPNDLSLDARPGNGKDAAKDPKDEKDRAPQILLLTGPNMAGKSTYIRSAALCTILAQMGAYVPAQAAEVGLVDRIFTRIGAADDLFGGRSTFMVEMAEVAEILAHASDRSLVILDEVGRGTSTYDGVSLAWAIVEHLHQGEAKPRTLFATHYHELCGLEQELPRVRNASAVVKEWQGEITFLHRIVTGPSERSFGLHVARLAGIPGPVIERARAILQELEAEAQDRVANVNVPASAKPKRRRIQPKHEDGQMMLFEPTEKEIDPRVKELLDDLRGTDANALSPIQALAKLDELVKKAKGKA
ncbi:MAG: DNA mismatch repair protein MutS [Planctomycetota bacterium]|nr:DNA mismatch repair protein MutS [Planctomycetota bacterium]